MYKTVHYFKCLILITTLIKGILVISLSMMKKINKLCQNNEKFKEEDGLFIVNTTYAVGGIAPS